MGFLDKVKRSGFFGGNEDIDDEEYYDEEEEYEDDEDEFEEEEYMKPEYTEQPIQRTTPAAKRTAYAAPRSDVSSSNDGGSSSDTRVLNIHATAQLQVVIRKPEVMDDAYDIADHLLKRHTVVLNLESTNKEIGKRIIDFLSGVAYANHGQLSKVANATFVITPYNVGLIGQDVIGELENSGVFF